ncbi:hypothetical protein SAMN05421813_13159 [Daejeonella rubra]|uniref:Uncharacterized protein n=1 Tax=Daejeonella rubra TaxID=990371 RepID=A0A1G9XNZ7_9SPHI|nr:hypothetical protein [Daejeonella rubra]SDM98494.1 hypothetical protein SAMN05421813_13159 [Daejeonella rubra]
MKLIQKYLQPGHYALSMEFTGIVVSVLIFITIPYAIRMIDISAAPIDPGIYSAIILAISAILIFKAGTWWIIKVIWPVFAEYSVRHFEYNFKSLQSIQKVLIYLGFYLSVFYAFVIVLAALI